MIASLLQWLGTCLAIMMVGALLYLIGNLLLGRKKEGGKRVVLFIAGLASCAFAACVCWLIIPAQPSLSIAWGMLALALVVGGLLLAGLSVFASNNSIRSCFDKFLSGI